MHSDPAHDRLWDGGVSTRKALILRSVLESDAHGAQCIDHLFHYRNQGGVRHLEVLNALTESRHDRMLLKIGDFAGASQELLDVLLQPVQDSAARLIHELGPFEIRIEPFELFTQLSILIVH